MTFFPTDNEKQVSCKKIIEANLALLNLTLLGYRTVPVDNNDLGRDSAETEPSIQQIFIKKPDLMTVEDFDRKLLVFRNYTEKTVRQQVDGVGADDFNIISCSYKTINYKGQLNTEQVPNYFLDLKNDKAKSALALVHSRFSTNTFPSWKLAQPFRYIAHNGEINTNKGNINWMKARESLLECTAFTKEELEMIFPICDLNASDSANLDMAIEMLLLSGRPLPHVLMMLIPEAWQNDDKMSKEKKAFYEFHSAIMEPWDGPASVCFTDGIIVGATLDRNGLRPSRYCVTDDDTLIMASESGVINVNHSKVKQRGRLQPGKMFVADLEQGRIISDEELKSELCKKQPYQEWLDQSMLHLSSLEVSSDFSRVEQDQKSLFKNQQVFGYTYEDITELIKPMATGGKEALGSMGADNPIAVLSDRPQQLSHYFKQLFAQVTNPPIDPIRERIVMDLRTYVGGFRNILTESKEQCRRIAINQPVLDEQDLSKLLSLNSPSFKSKVVDITFSPDHQEGSLEAALEQVFHHVEMAINDDCSIVILSDRKADINNVPIPSLLATSAVHHHLIRKGIRGSVDIVIESGDVKEVHHFATVLGYGASAICPYLTLDTIRQMEKDDLLNGLTADKAIKNYIKAIGGGLLKIFSKMGISTLASYQGAQIFEILGISSPVVDKYFSGSVSRIEGLTLDDIAFEAILKHRKGYPTRGGASKVLDPGENIIGELMESAIYLILKPSDYSRNQQEMLIMNNIKSIVKR